METKEKTIICDRLRVCKLCLVRLRGPSAKQFWEGLEWLNAQLEDLDVETKGESSF